MSKTIRLFEAFAGIGSQFKALKNIAIEKDWTIESVGIIEWFIPAIIAYQAIHHPPIDGVKEGEIFNANVNISNDSKNPLSKKLFDTITTNSAYGFWLNQSKDIAHNLFDISHVKGKDISKNIDIFTYSFPCQDISNQGKQRGFSKGSSTRSGLLWEVERILTEIYNEDKANLPKYLLLENVKNIISIQHLPTFNRWIRRLDQLGYETQWYLINATNYGSCQNRERVFAISVLKEHKKKVNFVFPKFDYIEMHKKPIKDILEKDINDWDEKLNNYELSEPSKITKNNIKKFELLNYSNFQSEKFVYDINYSGPTLTASGAMSRIKLLCGKGKIRSMIPLECFKYMGFDEEDWRRVNDTNLVKNIKQIYLCGNSISVEVLEAIFREFKF